MRSTNSFPLFFLVPPQHPASSHAATATRTRTLQSRFTAAPGVPTALLVACTRGSPSAPLISSAGTPLLAVAGEKAAIRIIHVGRMKTVACLQVLPASICCSLSNAPPSLFLFPGPRSLNQRLALPALRPQHAAVLQQRRVMPAVERCHLAVGRHIRRLARSPQRCFVARRARDGPNVCELRHGQQVPIPEP